MSAFGPEPGLHLRAVVVDGDGEPQEVRILGDDQRGYLVAGGFATDDRDEEFWFKTLAEALDTGARHGIERSAWDEAR